MASDCIETVGSPRRDILVRERGLGLNGSADNVAAVRESAAVVTVREMELIVNLIVCGVLRAAEGTRVHPPPSSRGSSNHPLHYRDPPLRAQGRLGTGYVKTRFSCSPVLLHHQISVTFVASDIFKPAASALAAHEIDIASVASVALISSGGVGSGLV